MTNKFAVLRKSLLFAGIASAALGLTACLDIAGGGWMFSKAGPDAKATFGFAFDCMAGPGPATAWGHITYHDHGWLVDVGARKPVKLAIQGEVTAPAPEVCGGFAGSYVGTYTPIPPTLGPGGAMYVVAIDSGATGPDKNDYLMITLSGGVFDGYANEGSPQGGNIELR